MSRRASAACGLVIIAFAGLPANAGDGTIVFGAPDVDGFTHSAAVQTKVYMATPRTQQEIAEFERQMKVANRQICDATDGIFRIDRVTFVSAPDEKDRADIWWHQGGGRANANLGNFGVGGVASQTDFQAAIEACFLAKQQGQPCDPALLATRCDDPTLPVQVGDTLGVINLYDGESGHTIAHELAHALFGIADLYPNEHLWDAGAFNLRYYRGPGLHGVDQVVDNFQGSGSGFSFFRPMPCGEDCLSLRDTHRAHSPFAYRMFASDVPTRRDGTTALYEFTTPGWWQQNNSLMQQSEQQVCRRLSDNFSHRDLNPLLFEATPCSSHADCAQFYAPGATPLPDEFGYCSGLPVPAGWPMLPATNLHIASELSVFGNFQLTRGGRTLGDASGVGTAPAVQPAKHLVIQGFLRSSMPAPPSGDSICRIDDDGDCINSCPMYDIVNHASSWNEFSCTGSNLYSTAGCPMSHEYNGIAVYDANCSGCVLAHVHECAEFDRTGMGGSCGDGVIQYRLDADRRSGTDPSTTGDTPDDWGEQCDPGAGQFNLPYTPAGAAEPMTCAQVRSLWREKALSERSFAETENIGEILPSQAMVGGQVYCNANCLFDLSRCAHMLTHPFDVIPKGEDGVLDLVDLRDNANLEAFAEVYDSLGEVALDRESVFDTSLDSGGLNLDEVGPSNHGVFVFMRKLFRYRPDGFDQTLPDPVPTAVHHDVWEAIIAMDDAEFAGPSGVAKVVDRLQLEYVMNYADDTGTLLAINGIEVTGPNAITTDAVTWPVVHIGHLDHSGLESDAFHPAGQAPTGSFSRTAAPGLSLRLDIRALGPFMAYDLDGTEVDWGKNGGALMVYARHAILDISTTPGVSRWVEVPQYANLRWGNGIAAGSNTPQDRMISLVEQLGYNVDTKRFDTSWGALFPYFRQLFGDEGTPGYDNVCTDPSHTHCSAAQALPDVVANRDAHLVKSDDWSRLEQTMCRRWGRRFQIRDEATSIEADAPTAGGACDATDPSTAGQRCENSSECGLGACLLDTTCPDPTFVNNTGTDFDEDTEVVFVLDRSGSMGSEDVYEAGENVTRSRLDYIKDATKSFAGDLLAGSASCVSGPFAGEPCSSPGSISVDCTTGNTCLSYSECEGGSDAADTSCLSNDDCSEGATCVVQDVGGARVGLLWYSDFNEDYSGGVADDLCATEGPDAACNGGIYTGECVCTDRDLATSGCIRFGCQRKLKTLVPGGFEMDGESTISIETFRAPLVTSEQSPNPSVKADGFTGTGAALLRASSYFSADTRKKLLVHLTDGINNRPLPEDLTGELCRDGSPFVDEEGCWPGTTAAAKYQQALSALQGPLGVTVFQYPLLLGFDSDPAAQAVANGNVSGELFDVYRWYGEDTIPAFFQGHAAKEGDSLAYDYENVPKLRGEIYNWTIEYDIPVEEGAERLSVRVSDWNNTRVVDEEQGVFERVPGPFLPENYLLVEPDGTEHFRSREFPRFDMNGRSLTFSVRQPAAGTWRVVDVSQRDNVYPELYRTAYVAAHVRNPLPICRTTPTSAVTDGLTPMAITAQAYYGLLPLATGVNYTGKLLRPDRILVDLEFRVDPVTGMARAVVAPEDLVGRGRYRAVVTCEATEDAAVRPGEGPDTEPIQPVPFTRQDSAGFFMNVAELAPWPGINSDPQPPGPLDGSPPEFAPIWPFLGDCDGDRIPNALEADTDANGNGVPDNCDPDSNGNDVPDGMDPDYPPANEDGDGIPGGLDNCDDVDNPDQHDADRDGIGDACETDADGDSIPNVSDNCPLVHNTSQDDADSDGIGDACEDADGDGYSPPFDNCKDVANPDQADLDGDGRGDACDNDDDQDKRPDVTDNCPIKYNPSQGDYDADGVGDACDVCPMATDPGQEDADHDGVGDACDMDPDGDKVEAGDNCPDDYNPDQKDSDSDGLGDVCDPDADDDDLTGPEDNCPYVYNPTQLDTDLDGIGDVCDCGPTTVQAEAMVHNAGGPLSGGWNLHSNGDITTTRELPGAPSTITVRAKGELAYGVGPHMLVYVGTELVGEMYVTKTQWDEYSFDFEVEPGEYEIRIAFDNDAYSSWPPADRNLHLDYFRTECSVSCEDGVQNQDETGEDCGGVCGPTCWNGEGCDDTSDCATDTCYENVCGGCLGPSCEEPPSSVVARAGADQVLECVNGVAVATLDGSGSEPVGGITSYQWTSSVPLSNANSVIATGTFPLGTNNAVLHVSDGAGNDSDAVLVTVLDTVAPSIVAPADVTAATCGAVSLGTPSASDSCGGALTIVNDAPSTFSAGVTTVTWMAIDAFGNVGTDTQLVVVGVGNNPSCCPAGSNVMMGTTNNDSLQGTSGRDCIIALGGQDTINGNGGDDIVSGGDGNDNITGGTGNDLLFGGTGQDTINGNSGHDVIFGGDGDDTCWGGTDNDTFYGGQGKDMIYGQDGNDTLYGQTEDDQLFGGNHDDHMDGGGLHDVCTGGSGTNTFNLCEVTQ